ncbi:thiamine biosynthesis protein ApbE [Thalassotalea sp. 42_200_T64]|nr:thiamine biosynthesis protein ApbE [Thalassotalea sp. 42_200_T64]
MQSTGFGFITQFHAMASPCEVLINSTDKRLAKKVGQAIANEAWRIEDKYSRYLSTSICAKINASNGKPVSLDEETYKLLDFARQCFLMSDGAFDITSGVLANAWTFDGSDNIPEQDKIQPLLKYIGFDQITLTANSVTLNQGMAIDFGGIGKEYAVDTSLLIAKSLTSLPVLINFGGDIAASSKLRNGNPWQVGIEHPGFVNSTSEKLPPLVVSISTGALATSGDARRFLLKDGKRYSHVLNPKTGYSIVGAPKSITVTAPNCIQAGFIATLALLQGKQAEQFLQQQDIGHWCIW